MQQIVAFETDLLDFDDIFDGSKAIAEKVVALKVEAGAELKRVLDMGGAVVAVEQGYMKRKLVEANEARMAAIETGATTVVGVNAYTDSEPSPLSNEGAAVVRVAEDAAEDQIARLRAWRMSRDSGAVRTTLAELQRAAEEGRNIMEPSIACARAGVTTGEWGDVMRRVFGEYRAPTGVSLRTPDQPTPSGGELRHRVAALSRRLGTPVRFLIGKPGLDGHSNGAEQIALRASACGMEVSYEGIRQTPQEIARAASERSVHLVGLSILSGAHVSMARDVINRLRELGLGQLPVVVGGIIPAADLAILKQCGAAAVYTPKDFALNRVLSDLVTLLENRLVGEQPESNPALRRRRQSAPRHRTAARRPVRR
jgi:(2R)-ethylmalonyl-CoA mutase